MGGFGDKFWMGPKKTEKKVFTFTTNQTNQTEAKELLTIQLKQMNDFMKQFTQEEVEFWQEEGYPIEELKEAADYLPKGAKATPPTTSGADLAKKAKEIRVASKYLAQQIEVLRADQATQLKMVVASSTETPSDTKDQLKAKLRLARDELMRQQGGQGYRQLGTKARELHALIQGLPVIENSPQGSAETAIRAIIAILKSNGEWSK